MAKTNSGAAIRAYAARQIHAVVIEHRSLGRGQQSELQLVPRDAALAQEIIYGVLRHHWSLSAQIKPLLKKPLKQKDQVLHSLLLVGLYQLHRLRVPAHAAVAETVSAVMALKRPWAKGLVNAVLRQSQRSALAANEQDLSANFDHPGWMVEAFVDAWPDHWQQMLEANNQRPVMDLRVNQLRLDRTEYLTHLKAVTLVAEPIAATDCGIKLERPVDVDQLPGFTAGDVSVQSRAAQLVTPLLDLAPGQRVLDACAAPGGKSAHILEAEPKLNCLVALDVDSHRLALLKSGLDRLQLRADCRTADAVDLDSWWDGVQFDRVLLDAPCSGSGVINRHPDIKHLRQAEDIAPMVIKQQALMESLWQVVKPGGLMIYTTCSVLPEENELQVQKFLATHSEARNDKLELTIGRQLEFGWQSLTGVDGADGFYYALLRRCDQ